MRAFVIEYQENGDSAFVQFAEPKDSVTYEVPDPSVTVTTVKRSDGLLVDRAPGGELVGIRVPDGAGGDFTLEDICDAMRDEAGD